LAGFEFESGTVSFCFSFIFVSFGESRLLVLWCAGGRCGMAFNDKDHGRSKGPGVEDLGWSHKLGTRWPGVREVWWRCVWSAPSTWRLGASKPRSMVCEWFDPTTTRTVSSGLASKPAVTVFSSLASKLVTTDSLGLASKPVVDFLVEPQNQAGGGFPGLGLKTGSFGSMI
jgi:hypothetical protein